MPRVTQPPPRVARPSGSPQGRPAPTLREPRDMRDRPNGLKLALRRQRRRIRPALYAIMTAAAVFCIAGIFEANRHDASLTTLRQRFGAVGTVFGLRVHAVVVNGRTATPAPLVDAALGVTPGDPLLAFSVSGARARLISIASIADATVERRWNGTILIDLTERHPTAVWQNQGRFVLIDKDGSELADQDVRLATQLQLPLVVGPGAPAHAAELLDALKLHPTIMDHLVAAVRVSDRRWNLRITSGADVELPADNQAAALDRLDSLQADHRLLDRKLRSIDLRLPDQVTLRPVADPTTATPAAPPAPTPAVTPTVARLHRVPARGLHT